MRIDIITIFPEMLEVPLGLSIIGRAQKEGRLKLGFVNPRDFTSDRHRTVDDRPYGGGAGMVMLAEPLHCSVKSIRRRGSTVVALSPQGRRLDQACVRRLARRRHLILVCGRYEGIDDRFLKDADLEISVGDFVLTGGEIPAMVVVDAVTRLLPGVLRRSESIREESFTERLLEYPQYTRPRMWRGRRVPEVLLSGDHREIARWRALQALRRTRQRRPDLIAVRKNHD